MRITSSIPILMVMADHRFDLALEVGHLVGKVSAHDGMQLNQSPFLLV